MGSAAGAVIFSSWSSLYLFSSRKKHKMQQFIIITAKPFSLLSSRDELCRLHTLSASNCRCCCCVVSRDTNSQFEWIIVPASLPNCRKKGRRGLNSEKKVQKQRSREEERSSQQHQQQISANQSFFPRLILTIFSPPSSLSFSFSRQLTCCLIVLAAGSAISSETHRSSLSLSWLT